MNARDTATRLVASIAITALLSGCGSSATPPPAPANAAATGLPTAPASAAAPSATATATAASPSRSAITPAPTVELTGFSMRGFVVGLPSDLYFAVDAAGNLYLPSGTPGAALVKVAPDGQVLARWAGLDVVKGQPDTVVGIAIEPGTGDVFATDTTADRVVHLTPDLVLRSSFGSTGPDRGQFISPGGIAFDANGHLLVAHMGNNRIETFATDGTGLDVWSAPGGTTAPVDVTTDQRGTVYVSSVLPMLGDASGWRAGEVLTFSPDHTALLALKSEDGVTYLYPDAAGDADGNVYVADPVRGLLKLSSSGKQLNAWAYPGGQSSAASVRVAPSGNVYTIACVDLPGDCQIAEFTPSGDLLAGWHAASTATGPGTKVEVRGHKLYLQCTGTGSPTIVWQAGYGGGGWSGTEQYLMGRLATISRVCVYDRLGMGFSDPNPDDDFLHWRQHMEDLHALLQEAGVTGPYVMVGHSYGGLLARVYAYLYPREVAGLVAIDPGHEDEFAGPVNAASPGAITTCTDASCPAYEEIQAVHALTHGKVAGSLGALPLIVLGHSPSLPFYAADYDTYWQGLVAGTAKASSNSRFVVASWSSHLIPLTQPGVVVEAVRQVVAAARAPSHALPACGTAFTSLGGTCR